VQANATGIRLQDTGAHEIADEVLSLATILIGAGAAGVVASLWAVNDYATAVLMSRFYEFLANGEPAPRALRNAQLWLRDLSDTEAGAPETRVRIPVAVPFKRSVAPGGRTRPPASGSRAGST
jgi:CHAT domain-containing protein